MKRSIIMRIIFSSLFLLFTFNSYALNLETLSEGQAAFNAGNYEKAVKLWQDIALQGNSDAQVLMGLAYANGWGVGQNMKAAEMWYYLAAENNNPSGQFLLGIYYITSTDNERLNSGITWLKRAAANGDVSAIRFVEKATEKNWFEYIENRNKLSAGRQLAANRPIQ